MNGTVDILPADKDAAEALAALIRSAFAGVASRFGITPENTPKHPSNCIGAWVTQAMDNGVGYYRLDLDGALCGCVALEQARPGIFYLERLAILPEWRCQGLGRRLVDHAGSQAVAAGGRTLEIGIIDAQAELKAWYGRLGFCQTRTARFDHLPFTVCFMKRELTAAPPFGKFPGES